MIAEGALREGDLARALAEQRRRGGKLGEVLVRLELITELQLTAFLARQFNLSPVMLDAEPVPDASVLGRLSAELAHGLGALPLAFREEERCLVVAIAEPLRGERLERLREHAQSWILPRLTTEMSLRRALARAYGAPTSGLAKVRPNPSPAMGAGVSVEHPVPTHPEVRALVELLTRKGLITAAEVGRLFDAGGDDGLASSASCHHREGATAGARPPPDLTRQEKTT